MFNFNADVYLIVYPHGAGGRFLQLCIDDDGAGFDIFKEYLESHQEAHIGQEHLYVSDEMIYIFIEQDRYAFGLHPDQVPGGSSKFGRQCTNLKVISINVTTEHSQELLKQRRARLGSPALCANETSLKTDHHLKCRFWFGKEPVLQLELEDYWEPEKAIPILSEFFKKHNLNTRWQELYQVWYDNSIKNNS